jgi:hypothetical protein
MPKVKHKIVGKVPAPDGNGEMLKVVIQSPGGTEMTWYTRRSRKDVAGQVAKMQSRLVDRFNG